MAIWEGQSVSRDKCKSPVIWGIFLMSENKDQCDRLKNWGRIEGMSSER